MTDSDITEEPAPRSAAEPRRGARLVIAAAVMLLVAAGVWLVLDDAEQQQAEAPGAALDDAPTLQELAAQADGPSGDDAAPDFSVPTNTGTAFTLSHHLAEDGRPVILNLWASWCFPCRAEMPAIDAFATAHPEVAVIGVAVQDDVVAAEEFAEEIGVAYPLGFDEKDEVNDEYRPLGLPATFFISADGTIAKRHFGTVTEESLAADVAELFG